MVNPLDVVFSYENNYESIEVTVVLTSCNRYDLLEQTIDSFLAYNTYTNIKDFFVIEDFYYNQNINRLIIKYPSIKFIINDQRIGQIKSIDKIYKNINTKYIFHMEDDWLFYRSGFIEESVEFLEKSENMNIIQLWLRERHDTNGHPVVGNLLSLNYVNEWHGFSFNPGLKRLSDYKILSSYEKAVQDYKSKYYFPNNPESIIGIIYKNLGYRAAISEKGFLRHIGYGRTVQ